MKMKMIRSVIVASGSYIPELRIKNEKFLHQEFFEKDGSRVQHQNGSIIEKFKAITGIEERRYAKPGQQASDLGYLAAKDALESSGIDKESLDYIIVAHNFGDVAEKSNRVNMLPSMASRIKYLLKIQNPNCIAYDLPFGCPGWVEGVIQANYFIRSGDVKRCMVIGTETLSRIIDPSDRDSMIFSDGSGAVILDASENGEGIIAHKTQTYASEHAMLLNMGRSYAPDGERADDLFLKMNGRKVYEFALQYLPLLVKATLEKAGLGLSDIKKVLIHQANEKMDNAILQRLFTLCGLESISDELMPMTISWLGNSSVATIPTMLDLILKKKLDNHAISPGDNVLMASVGAGMNINALIYKF